MCFHLFYITFTQEFVNSMYIQCMYHVYELFMHSFYVLNGVLISQLVRCFSV